MVQDWSSLNKTALCLSWYSRCWKWSEIFLSDKIFGLIPNGKKTLLLQVVCILVCFLVLFQLVLNIPGRSLQLVTRILTSKTFLWCDGQAENSYWRICTEKEKLSSCKCFFFFVCAFVQSKTESYRDQWYSHQHILYLFRHSCHKWYVSVVVTLSGGFDWLQGRCSPESFEK